MSQQAQGHHTVIVGAGFAGLWAEHTLARAQQRVTLIDARNYHLFQPLLYQVATAALSPGDIAQPIRSIVKDHPNTRVLMAALESMDREQRQVKLDTGLVIDYDSLIIATGATHSYFGNEHWAEHAPGLKNIDDATAIRRQLLTAFEKAETAETDQEREKLLRFLVIGGGPTGVEIAGTLAEIARRELPKEFRSIDTGRAQVILIEAGQRLLPQFPEKLSQATFDSLEELGVTPMLGSIVTDIEAGRVSVQRGEHSVVLEANTVIWAAGVKASPAAQWLGVEGDRAGRVPVNACLQLPGDQHVYVVGDTAAIKDAEGRPVPGVAPAAKQAGRYAAESILRSLGGEAAQDFNYKDNGNLATIGRNRAVADVGGFQLSGRLAWWFWGLVHVYFLIGFKNRLAVVINWLWAYFGLKRGVRLITQVPVDKAAAEKKKEKGVA